MKKKTILMIIKNKNTIRLFYIFVIMLIYVLSLAYPQTINKDLNYVSVQLNEEGLTRKQITEAIENENLKNHNVPMVTAWNKNMKSDIYSCEVNDIKKYKEKFKKSHADVFEVYGNYNDVIPIYLIDGSYVSCEDDKSCIIDKKTAYELFGTVYASNNNILIDDKVYTVRGVADINLKFIMYMSQDEKTEFKNLEFKNYDVERGSELVGDFLVQNNLSDDYVCVENGFYGRLAEKFSYLPGQLLALFMIFKSSKIFLGNLKLKYNAVIYTIIYIFFVYLLLKITKFQLYLPSRIIPTKWSDFEFWINKYKDLKSSVEEITYLMPTVKNVIVMKYIRRSVVFTILSTIAFAKMIINNRRIAIWLYADKNHILKKIVLISSSIIISALIIKFIMIYRKFYFDMPVFYWIILPVFFSFIAFDKFAHEREEK